MISIPLFQTQEHPCAYLEGEQAQSVFVHPAYPVTTSIYAQLIEQGFRRSGDEIYAPHCPHCFACIPARLPVQKFKPSRSQKRCIRGILIQRQSSSPQFLNKPITICIYAIRLSGTVKDPWPMPALMITSVFWVAHGATPALLSFRSIMSWPGSRLSINLSRHGQQFILFLNQNFPATALGFMPFYGKLSKPACNKRNIYTWGSG
jgi:hypothetical protein